MGKRGSGEERDGCMGMFHSQLLCNRKFEEVKFQLHSFSTVRAGEASKSVSTGFPLGFKRQRRPIAPRPLSTAALSELCTDRWRTHFYFFQCLSMSLSISRHLLRAVGQSKLKGSTTAFIVSGSGINVMHFLNGPRAFFHPPPYPP